MTVNTATLPSRVVVALLFISFGSFAMPACSPRTREPDATRPTAAIETNPLQGFAHLASGEWTTILASGTVLRETWRWEEDSRSLRVIGGSISPTRDPWHEEQVFFVDPVTNTVRVRGSNSYRNGTFEGAVTFGEKTAQAQIDITQEGDVRHLVRRWTFVDDARFDTELLEVIEGEGLVPLVSWTYLRSSAPDALHQPAESTTMNISPSSQVSFPTSHHGVWKGENRLWIMDPAKPFTSDGAIEIGDRTVRYTWSHEGKPQTGELTLKGQPGALQATWTDTFHAREPMTLHGFLEMSPEIGVLRLFTTYDAGEATWGWIIELDFRAPATCTMRMSNVMPGLGAVPAVLLEGTR
jgi:hypothetical protein